MTLDLRCYLVTSGIDRHTIETAAAAAGAGAGMVLATLADPKMAPLMTSGKFEVVGIAPLGAAYVMVRDRAINSVEKAAGKTVLAITHDDHYFDQADRLLKMDGGRLSELTGEARDRATQDAVREIGGSIPA